MSYIRCSINIFNVDTNEYSAEGDSAIIHSPVRYQRAHDIQWALANITLTNVSRLVLITPFIPLLCNVGAQMLIQTVAGWQALWSGNQLILRNGSH